MKFIPYNKQNINQSDINNVTKALKQSLITTGPLVAKFDNKISKLLDSKYAVSCSSGTAALHLSLMSLQLKKKDIVIMPAVNFVAIYNISKLLDLDVVVLLFFNTLVVCFFLKDLDKLFSNKLKYEFIII